MTKCGSELALVVGVVMRTEISDGVGWNDIVTWKVCPSVQSISSGSRCANELLSFFDAGDRQVACHVQARDFFDKNLRVTVGCNKFLAHRSGGGGFRAHVLPPTIFTIVSGTETCVPA